MGGKKKIKRETEREGGKEGEGERKERGREREREKERKANKVNDNRFRISLVEHLFIEYLENEVFEK